MAVDDPAGVMQHITDWLWVLPTAIAGYGSFSFRKLVDSVTSLNTNVALVVQKLGTHDDRINDHESRLRQGKL